MTRTFLHLSTNNTLPIPLTSRTITRQYTPGRNNRTKEQQRREKSAYVILESCDGDENDAGDRADEHDEIEVSLLFCILWV